MSTSPTRAKRGSSWPSNRGAPALIAPLEASRRPCSKAPRSPGTLPEATRRCIIAPESASRSLQAPQSRRSPCAGRVVSRAATSRTAGACACPGAAGTGFGCIGLLVVIVIAMLTGADPRQLLGLLGLVEQMAPPQAQQQQVPEGLPPADDPQAQFVGVVLKDTENAWQQVFQRSGERYQDPTLVLFDGRVASACGMASAAVGPFYCPADRKVYLDTAFFRELVAALRRARRLRPGVRRRARGGPPRPEPAGPLRPGDRPPAAGAFARSRRTTSRSASSCRPTASPGSTATSTSSTSTPATSRRGCARPPRSATT